MLHINIIITHLASIITPLSVSDVTHHTYLAANNIYCSRDNGQDTAGAWRDYFSEEIPFCSDHDYVSYEAPGDQVWPHPPVCPGHQGEARHSQAVTPASYSEEETSDTFDETITSIARDTMSQLESQLDIVSAALYRSVFTDSYEAGEVGGGSLELDNSCNLDLAPCSDGNDQKLLK